MMKQLIYALTLFMCVIYTANIYAGSEWEKSENSKHSEFGQSQKDKNKDKKSGKDKDDEDDIDDVASTLELIGYYDYFVDECKSSDATEKNYLVTILDNTLDEAELPSTSEVNTLVSKIITKGKDKAKKVKDSKTSNIFCQHNAELQIRYNAFLKKNGI